MVYESSIEFRRYLCYLLSTRKQLLFCISVFCICQICFSLVPKSPVPTTLLTELSSLIPLRRSVSRREVNNQFVKSRRLQLAMCRISESEVSPDNFYTSSREGASTLHESHYIPSGYEGARVLLVGDGDLSFAASLSTLRICQR